IILSRSLPNSTVFPYTTLFRSRIGLRVTSRKLSAVTRIRSADSRESSSIPRRCRSGAFVIPQFPCRLSQEAERLVSLSRRMSLRSEEHTSELQSRENLVCRLLL